MVNGIKKQLQGNVVFIYSVMMQKQSVSDCVLSFIRCCNVKWHIRKPWVSRCKISVQQRVGGSMWKIEIGERNYNWKGFSWVVPSTGGRNISVVRCLAYICGNVRCRIHCAIVLFYKKFTIREGPRAVKKIGGYIEWYHHHKLSKSEHYVVLCKFTFRLA